VKLILATASDQMTLEALEASLKNGHLEVARFLIEKGADDDYLGYKMLLLACRHGCLQITRLLVERQTDGRILNGEEYDDPGTPLNFACYYGHLETARFLIESGAAVNAAENTFYGWTPLHFACSQGNLPVAQLLINNGADVNISDERGITPMHLACEKGYLKIIHVFIDEMQLSTRYNTS
jgi:ankyrin repeat protein